MARSPDPVVDLERCAEHLDSTALLIATVIGPIPEVDMIRGLADRVRDNTQALRAGTKNSSDQDYMLPAGWKPLGPHPAS